MTLGEFRCVREANLQKFFTRSKVSLKHQGSTLFSLISKYKLVCVGVGVGVCVCVRVCFLASKIQFCGSFYYINLLLILFVVLVAFQALYKPAPEPRKSSDSEATSTSSEESDSSSEPERESKSRKSKQSYKKKGKQSKIRSAGVEKPPVKTVVFVPKVIVYLLLMQ
jgi:hypothetical protein